MPLIVATLHGIEWAIEIPQKCPNRSSITKQFMLASI